MTTDQALDDVQADIIVSIRVELARLSTSIEVLRQEAKEDVNLQTYRNYLSHLDAALCCLNNGYQHLHFARRQLTNRRKLVP